jgi:hypothetical protein
LPFYGFAARAHFVDGGLQPPPDFDFEQLAEWGREAVINYLDGLSRIV